MKVKGRPGEITPNQYAREVGERMVAHIVATLEQAGKDVELPNPDDLIESVEGMVIYLPEQSPNELAALLGPFWSGARVRQALDIRTRQALASRARNGSVLALKNADGDVFYPISQFHKRPDGTIEVKPALLPLLRALRRFDPWAVGVLLHTPAPELGNLTPLDWARNNNDPETLTNLAQTVAREWSAGAA